MNAGLLPDAPVGLPGPRVPDEAAAAAQGLPLVLGYRDGRLSLWPPQSAAGALCVDFSSGSLGYRLSADRARHERLVRAAGAPELANEPLIDATAGLGRDAVLLARAGYRVTLVERSALLHALLADGLARAAETLPELCERLSLLHGDGRELLAQRQAGVVSLDPMFPPRKKSAAVKKELRWLQWLEAPLTPEEETQLLDAALASARRKVVVKRPVRAQPLAGRKPAHSLRGKAVRFDVYVAPLRGAGQGARDKGQGTRDKGQGTRDKGQGTRDKEKHRGFVAFSHALAPCPLPLARRPAGALRRIRRCLADAGAGEPLYGQAYFRRQHAAGFVVQGFEPVVEAQPSAFAAMDQSAGL